LAEQTLVLLAELVALRTKWESRIVEVRNGDLTTTLFVNFGEIAAVKSSKPGEPIGRLMVRKGLISREHYIEVLERLDDVLATGQRVAFGEVAVGLGYAKPADVSSCLTDQVRALAMRVFQGEPPQWTVGPLPTDRDPSRDLVMRVESVFLEAIRPLDDARKAAMGLEAARTRALGPTWTLDEIDVRLELTEDEVRFVHQALAGDKTVDTLLSSSAYPGVDVRSILTALVATGAAESRALTAAEQRDLPKRRKEPPPLPLWAAVDVTRAKGAAETAARAMETAGRAKLSLAPKPTASPLAQLLRAEQHLEHGRGALVGGDVQGALTELERALELNPASIETQLFVGWCHHRLTKMPLTGATRDDLERLARQGIRENPQIAIANLVLAAVEESVGRPNEAATALARARTIDRELVDGAPPAPPLISDPPVPPGLPSGAPALSIPAATPPVPAAALAPAPSAAPAAAPPAAPAAPPPRPAASAPESVAPPSKGAPVGAILGGLLVLAGIGAAVFFFRPGSPPVAASPDAGATSGAASTSASASGTTMSPRTASFDGGALADAGGAKPGPVKVDAAHGVIRLPPNARGHRVFVDGKATISEPDRVTVLCGHRDIQIGSRGATHGIDVPCGGATDLPP
jgi:hypothetical protein